MALACDQPLVVGLDLRQGLSQFVLYHHQADFHLQV
jgi:hypothetical protein